MKKEPSILALIALVGAVVYIGSFSNFFAQDDFILITDYNKGNIVQNFSHIFAYPSISHFRPLHDFYFVLAGALFGKNYFGYHLITFLCLVAASYLIYKVALVLTNNSKMAVSASLIYATSSIHFMSMYWISGSATLLGFLFFIASFWALLKNNRLLSMFFYLIALLGSESMIVGVVLFASYAFLFKKKRLGRNVILLCAVGLIYSAVRFLFLTPGSTYDAYKLSFNPALVNTLRYYLLRLLGVSEGVNDLALKLAGLFFSGTAILLLVFKIKSGLPKILIFAVVSIFCGLFPFIFISNHLAANYMSLSFFGVALAVAWALKDLQRNFLIIFLAFWILVQAISVNHLANESWATTRAELSRKIITDIEVKNPPDGTTLVFDEKIYGGSKESYITLGEGRAINFWFPEKNYKTCFTFISVCDEPSF